MAERKRRTAKEKVIIRDEMLTPYFIEVDETSYNLYKEGSTLAEGYYSTLSGALRKIVRSQIVCNSSDEVSLKDYVNTMESSYNKLTETFKF